jgi:hypothetical protein
MNKIDSFSSVRGFNVSLYLPAIDLVAQEIECQSLEVDYYYFLRSHDYKTSVKIFANAKWHQLDVRELLVFKRSDSVELNCSSRSKFTIVGIRRQYFDRERSYYPSSEYWTPRIYPNVQEWLFEELSQYAAECENSLPGKTEMLKSIELTITHKILRILSHCSK